MGFLIIFIQTLVLVFALGIDALVCSFSYGVNKIRIPKRSMVMINVITTVLLGLGIILARFMGEFLPPVAVYILSFSILFILGLSKIFEGAIKAMIKRNKGSRDFNFSLFNMGFVLQIFAQYELADVDESKELSLSEAIPLAFAVGFDGLSVGLSVGLMQLDVSLLLVMAFFVGLICVWLGDFFGRKLSKQLTFDFSIISGLILIGIAVFNLF